MIGNHRLLSPNKLQDFTKRAEELDYIVIFAEEPTEILKSYERLNEKPQVEILSSLPGTTKGFLPYQLQGYNFLKDQKAGVAMWSTGTGKTVLAASLLKYHADLGDFDVAWVVVKAHNKVNTQRTLKRLADIDSLVLDGPQKRRHEALAGLLEDPASPNVVITNYEKFRIDQAHLLPLFQKRVLIIWDEMPTKLKSRKTQLYKSIRKCLYTKVDLSAERPADLRQYMLSATPIENGPEDWYNCVRLLDPSVYGKINDFRDEYVQSYNPFSYEPQVWQNLDKMGLKAAHITHQVDKDSPEISAQFPQVIEEPYYIDWDKGDRAIYNLLAEEAKKKVIDRDYFDTQGVFGFLQVMQMLCNAPSMVSNSASLREAWDLGIISQKAGSEVALELQRILTRKLNDDAHTKLQTLKELLLETHPNEKVVIFSSYSATLLPILEKHLNDWLVPYVTYEGTAKEKQKAQDYFTNENFVRVFLSSDKGSDSISLEQASVVIHYDLPWKWSTYIQRQNRIHRVTSEHDKVRYYTLMMADSVEERKLKILKKKQKFHNEVFKGAISDQSESAQMTSEDLLYILGVG
jgi:SNF2 family DNA or RNA helicase